MKRLFTAFVASTALLLTGCGFDSEKCMDKIAAANQMSFEAMQKQAEVMLAALNGTDQMARGIAMGWFMNADKRAQMMGYGDCNRDTALAWASVLIPGTTNLVGILQNAKTARQASDNSLESQRIMFGTMQGIATGAFNNPTYLPMQPSETPTYLPVTPGTQSLRPVEATPTTTP
jgi:hypothetical protein